MNPTVAIAIVIAIKAGILIFVVVTAFAYLMLSNAKC